MIFRKNNHRGVETNYDSSKEDYSGLGYNFNLESQEEFVPYNGEYKTIIKEEVPKVTRMTDEERLKQQRMFELLESGEDSEELERLIQELGESKGI